MMSMYSAVSGLNASAKQMDVIGNNIANVNTVGYKASTMAFSDILSQSLSSGASTGMQVGRGVTVADVQTQFGVGSFESTSNATDLSIDGDGFFIVKDDNGATYYTRAGQFSINSEGQLVDINGYMVQGYFYLGNNSETIRNISLKNVESDPEATTQFSVGANLDWETAAGDTFMATQTIYDEAGAAHTLSLTFQKTEQSGAWSVQADLEGYTGTIDMNYTGLRFASDGSLSEVYSATATGTAATVGDGDITSVTVNKEGQIYATESLLLTRATSGNSWTVADNDGGDFIYENAVVEVDTVDDIITIDLDGEGGADITFDLEGTWADDDTIQLDLTHSAHGAVADVQLDFSGGSLNNGSDIGDASNVVNWDLQGSSAEVIHSYASSSLVNAMNNDGYAAGELMGVSVSTEGIITGFFTNGQSTDIGQIVLADFPNSNGLRKMGANLYVEAMESGDPRVDAPGSSAMGEIISNSLEMSNVDLAAEFVRMITAQRAYQANSKVVTTVDDMLATVMNLKR